MSMYYALENARLREKNAAMLRELDTMRAARDAALEDLDFAKALADAANAVAGESNRISRQALNDRDAALARAADSDARLVRAIDAAKAAALAALAAPSPAGRLDAIVRMVDGVRVETRGFEQLNPDDYLFFDAAEGGSFAACNGGDCPLCTKFLDDVVDDGLDSGDGLDAARKGRTTPSARR